MCDVCGCGVIVCVHVWWVYVCGVCMAGVWAGWYVYV